jgi:hypothetical protein
VAEVRLERRVGAESASGASKGKAAGGFRVVLRGAQSFGLIGS